MLKRVVLLVVLVMSIFASVSGQQQRSLRLSSFPTVAVADGRSTIAVTAEVREPSGALAPDGTRIVFTTTLGFFRESVVTTSNGLARAILISGNIKGVAKITAAELTGQSNPTVIDFEFVGSKAELSSALEYVDIQSNDYLEYTYDSRLIAASAPNQGVTLRYRSVLIKAVDLQFNCETLEVRARNAELTIGGLKRSYSELYLQLRGRKGIGLTKFMGFRPNAFRYGSLWAPIIGFEEDRDDPTKLTISKPRERFGQVTISATEDNPKYDQVGPETFAFADIGASLYTLTASSATIFPNRLLQFKKVKVRVGGKAEVTLPLQQLRWNTQPGQVLGDEVLSVTDSQIGVNYPYFIGLSPSTSSLARFRTGQNLGRGVNVNRGVFFDFESNWNKGDDYQGGLTWSGLGRDDYGLGVRQFNRLNERTNLSLQVDAPAGKSLFAASSLSQQAPGFNWTANANGNRSLVGLRNTSESFNLVAETNPVKVGKLPFQLYYGVRADSTRRSSEQLVSTIVNNSTVTSIVTDSQSLNSYGLQLRGNSSSLKVDRYNSVQLGFTLNQLNGDNIPQPLTFFGQATLASQFSSALRNTLTLDYVRDPFTELALGRYRLTTQTSYYSGRWLSSIFASRSLDINRTSFFGDISYRFSPKWRIGYAYTLDQQDAGSFVDFNIVLGANVAGREIGLLYSSRTKRVGLQILNASF